MSSCSMYNISSQRPENWTLSDDDIIPCIHGYDYDKTWYKRTPVSEENWVCDRALYQTNAFTFHRIGEILGTFIFGQLGDKYFASQHVTIYCMNLFAGSGGDRFSISAWLSQSSDDSRQS